jgi:hypothetical protein
MLPQSQYPVLLASGFIEADGLRQPHDPLLEDYCLLPVTSLYPLDVERADIFPLAFHEPGQLAQVAEMLVVHRGGAWLVVRGDREYGRRVAEQVARHLEQSSPGEPSGKWQINDAQSFGHVQTMRLSQENAIPDRRAARAGGNETSAQP